MTARPRLALLAFAAMLAWVLPARVAKAEPWWCKPRLGVGAAVAGEAIGKLGGHAFGGRVFGQAFETTNSVKVPYPTPSSVFAECIGDRLGDEPPEDPPPDEPIVFPNGVPPEGDNSWIYGDPHLTTRDGLRYSFGGAGDYVLAEAEGVELQARFVRRSLGSPASVPSAVALRIDGVTVILMQDRDPKLRRRQALIDGERVEFDSGSWFSLPRGYVHRAGDLWRIEVPGVLALAMAANRTTIEVLFADALADPTRGLLGDGDGLADNDLRAADGAPVDPRATDVLYGAFLDAWLRTGSASLFTEPYDEARSGPVRPSEVRTFGDLPAEERDAAVAQCIEAGVLPAGPLLECAYDLLVVEDEALLLDHRAASLGTAGALSAELVFGSGTAAIGTLELGDAVRADVPSAGAGILDESGEVDAFDLSLGPEATAFVRVDAPCAATSPIRIALSSDSGESVEAALLCAAAIPVAAGTKRLSIYTVGGGRQQYAFTLLAPGSKDLGVLPFDTPISGRWEAPGEVFGEVQPAGATVSAQPKDGMSCARDWALMDGTGATLARAPQCVRLHAVPLEGTPPFTLRLSDGPFDAPFAFTLERTGDPGPLVPETLSFTPRAAGEPVDETFELGPGERLYVEAVPESATGGRFFLFAPDDREVDLWRAGLDAFVEDTGPGTWTLRFVPDADDVGDVRVLLHRVPADVVVDGALGEVARLTIVAPGQRASVRFALEAGQRVYADRSPDALVLGRLRLAAPSGAIVAETLLSQQDLLYSAADSGLYTLTWDGLNATTGSIEVELFEVADDTREMVSPGDRVTLTVTTPGQIAEAHFELAVGEVVLLSADVDSGVVLELWGPEGTRLRPAVGSATVEVDAADTGPGAYILRLRGTNERTGSALLSID